MCVWEDLKSAISDTTPHRRLTQAHVNLAVFPHLFGHRI